MQILKQSTAVDVMLGVFVDDSDGKTTEEALTLAQADLQLSKNCGAAAQKNDATSATHIYGGNYKVPLNATDTNTLGRLDLMCKEAGALPVKASFMVVPANVYDSLFGTDKLQVDVTQLLGTAWLTPSVAGTPDVNVKKLGGTVQTGRDIGASVLLSSGTGTGQLDFTSGVVKSNLSQILGDAQSVTDLKDFADAGYDPTTNKVEGVKLVDTTTTNTDMRGTDGANTEKTGFKLAADGADLVECNVATVGAAPTLLINKVQAIWNRLFTKKEVIATKETSYEKDNTTEMETWVLADDDTTASRTP